jgi:hypothetical protein
MVIPAVWIVRSKRHAMLGGDALYFHNQAQAIRSGLGWFISPITYIQNPSVVHPGASHPPLWTFLLFIADSIGLTSYFSQLLLACVLGAAAVAMTGLAAREFAGPRAGSRPPLRRYIRTTGSTTGSGWARPPSYS